MNTKPVPRLHLVGPLGILDHDHYVELGSTAAAAGFDAIHVRLPGAPGGVVLELAGKLSNLLLGGYARLIINDRADVASLLNAHIQLGEQSLPIRAVRSLLGDEALIGRSVHGLDGARRAEADGADYVLAGHVFDTPSKTGEPGRGLVWLREVSAGVRVPVIAIGGITAHRAPGVLAAGAYGIAVGRELLQATDPRASAIALRYVLDRNVPMTSSTSTDITIHLNGASITCPTGTTLGALLDGRGVERRMIAVEYNEEIVPRHEYDSITLVEGDRLEVVQMVGGG